MKLLPILFLLTSCATVDRERQAIITVISAKAGPGPVEIPKAIRRP